MSHFSSQIWETSTGGKDTSPNHQNTKESLIKTSKHSFKQTIILKTKYTNFQQFKHLIFYSDLKGNDWKSHDSQPDHF